MLERRGVPRGKLLVAIPMLIVALCVQAAPSDAAVTGHPRLFLTSSDLPRLRSRASATNRFWTQGLQALALNARRQMDEGTIPKGDGGGTEYEQYPSELYAELFAFMSLVDPDAGARADWGRRARTMLMYVVDRALPGLGADDTPFREPRFSTGNRSRYYGESFGLALDWAYGFFSAGDKAKIRTVYSRWADEQYTAYPLDQLDQATVPTVDGRAEDPRLLRDRYSVRWSINNYYIGHARNLGLMAAAFDPADDPGNLMRRHIANVTGQWLFVIDHMMRTDAAGGLSPEGFEYGADAMGRLAQLLYALRTAGLAGPEAGRQSRMETNRFWTDSISGLLSSLPTKPIRLRGANAFLSPVFQPAWYGDGESYWAADPIPLIGPIGLDAAARGDAATLNAARWMVKNIPPGGKAQLVNRVGSTDNFLASIMYFLLLDPAAREPTDPRKTLATTYVAPGIGRILARTCWCASERFFTFMLSWNQIDHQRGDGNDFGFLRKGEWLTKVRVGYSNPVTDYHNAVTIQNNPFTGDPNDFRVIGSKSGSQWALIPAGDPAILALGRTSGYTYALGDATKIYNSNAENINDVRHASRSIIWLKPDVIVVYDRAVTGKRNRFKRFWLQLPAAARITGRLATVRTPRGQRLYVTTLAPAKATLRATRDTDFGLPAVEEPMKFRLSVEATGRPRSARFLHVLQGADGNRGRSQTSALRSTAGTPFAGAAVSATAVLFPVTLSSRFAGFTVPLPARVRRVLVTGLKRGGSYTARRGGGRLRVSPGGALRATTAGVLELRS